MAKWQVSIGKTNQVQTNIYIVPRQFSQIFRVSTCDFNLKHDYRMTEKKDVATHQKDYWADTNYQLKSTCYVAGLIIIMITRRSWPAVTFYVSFLVCESRDCDSFWTFHHNKTFNSNLLITLAYRFISLYSQAFQSLSFITFGQIDVDNISITEILDERELSDRK